MMPPTAATAPIDQTQALYAVQASLRAALLAAPWPDGLFKAALGVLSEPTRVYGGRLTPWALAPLCCCAATAGGEWRPAVPAAAAAELFGVALDLFDEVEDGDASPAVEHYGAPLVINLATALLALAHRALLPPDTDEPDPTLPGAYRRGQDALWHGLAVATGGQHADLAAAGAPALGVEECLDIARRKSGALAEACCRAGAAFGTADPLLIERFGLFGRSCGLISQLDNDMHDAESDARKSDLARRHQTVPIALARRNGEPNDLGGAVWQGGVQMAYALLMAEHERAEQMLSTVARDCPDPALARAALAPLVRMHHAEPLEAAG